MGVPGWLLKIVMAFLTGRKMLVRYKGKQSGIKSLPGGGPQGTLLGLLLFIVLINDAGFSGQLNNVGDLITSRKNMRAVNEIHLKYVDDLTLGKAINLPEKLVSAPVDRQQPDYFHARTGHILPGESSIVFKQLRETEEYARGNDMKINYKKTKIIVFNPCTSIDFQPEFTLGWHDLEVVEEIRLLGIIVRSDLKWHSNSENLVQKSNKRLWMLRRLSKLGATREDQVDVFIKQIRSVFQLGREPLAKLRKCR